MIYQENTLVVIKYNLREQNAMKENSVVITNKNSFMCH